MSNVVVVQYRKYVDVCDAFFKIVNIITPQKDFQTWSKENQILYNDNDVMCCYSTTDRTLFII